jgi:phosphoribosyl 1,2-cyclic phosphodiesterase
LQGVFVPTNIFDHSKAVRNLLKAGVDCYMSWGTSRRLGTEDSHRSYPLENNLLHDIEGTDWRVLPFSLEHDAIEPLGFYVSHGFDRFLFIPDTAYVANTFTGITQIAIECNYIGEILSKNILNGNLPPVVGKRIRRNHMSLENVIEMLKANDLSRCRAIYLIHLSDGNSDEAEMIKKVQEATGVPCYPA